MNKRELLFVFPNHMLFHPLYQGGWDNRTQEFNRAATNHRYRWMGDSWSMVMMAELEELQVMTVFTCVLGWSVEVWVAESEGFDLIDGAEEVMHASRSSLFQHESAGALSGQLMFCSFLWTLPSQPPVAQKSKRRCFTLVLRIDAAGEGGKMN